MTETTVTGWRADARATEIYRSVFGEDILDHALVGEEYGGSYGNAVVEDDGTLPTGGAVVLVFRNGRRVQLWTSEWGGVTLKVGDGRD